MKIDYPRKRKCFKCGSDLTFLPKQECLENECKTIYVWVCLECGKIIKEEKNEKAKKKEKI